MVLSVLVASLSVALLMSLSFSRFLCFFLSLSLSRSFVSSINDHRSGRGDAFNSNQNSPARLHMEKVRERERNRWRGRKKEEEGKNRVNIENEIRTKQVE